MFLSTVSDSSDSHGLGRWARAASYVAAALAGAAGFALTRRAVASARGGRLDSRAARRGGAPSTRLMDAGWAAVVDDRGAVLARGQVILASPQAGARGRAPVGEVRSLRLAPGTRRLMPGRYWLRFETGRGTHGVEVTAFPGAGDGDVAAIRWDDRDLPSSLVELGTH